MKALIYILFTVLVLSIFTACTSEPGGKEKLEEGVLDQEKQPSVLDETSENAKLPREYGDMLRAMAKNPKDHKTNGLYTNNIATFYVRKGLNDKAIETLKRGISYYPNSNKTSENTLLLLDVLKSDASKKQDYINVVQSLKIGNPNLDGLEKFTGDVPLGEPGIKEKISTIQKNLTDKSTGRLDLLKVNEFINIIEYFALSNPKSEVSAKYLKLAAEVVNSVKVYPRAIEFYDWILNNFPESKEVPQALFMKGFTLDDGMGNKQAAKAVYEEFLRKYPKNDFADDTKFLLDNINKSDEEIIKQFDTNKK